MISNAYRSPLVQQIVLDVVRRLKEGQTKVDVKYTINADLVPKVSERMLRIQKFEESSIPAIKSEQPVLPFQKMEQSLTLNTIVEPHAPPKIIYPSPQVQQPKKLLPPQSSLGPQTVYELPEMTAPKIQPMPSLSNVQLNELYRGKMAGLLNDPSVLSIECVGQNVPLNIFRGGQKQRTKVILTKIEIDNLLNEISKQSKIPLGEGVFRVIVNNLMINAVISDLVGTRFVIKKLFSMNNQQRH